jgi:hypothetical protein
LADALSVALRRTGRAITKVRATESEKMKPVAEKGE